MYEYCAGKHWILYWIQENKTATYYLRSRLFTYDISACAKLFVDEESTWHKSNRGIEQNIDGLYTKMTHKGGFSKLCVQKLKKDDIPIYSIFQHVSII
jgi:hypothetical protein